MRVSTDANGPIVTVGVGRASGRKSDDLRIGESLDVSGWGSLLLTGVDGNVAHFTFTGA